MIAASAGNHALALAYHGKELNVPVTVVMPLNAPIMKINACKKYGANVHVIGSDIIEVCSFRKLFIWSPLHALFGVGGSRAFASYCAQGHTHHEVTALGVSHSFKTAV